jgi:hypothetical protein
MKAEPSALSQTTMKEAVLDDSAASGTSAKHLLGTPLEQFADWKYKLRPYLSTVGLVRAIVRLTAIRSSRVSGQLLYFGPDRSPAGPGFDGTEIIAACRRG